MTKRAAENLTCTAAAKKAGEITLSVPGAHNVSNALAVFACAEKNSV